MAATRFGSVPAPAARATFFAFTGFFPVLPITASLPFVAMSRGADLPRSPLWAIARPTDAPCLPFWATPRLRVAPCFCVFLLALAMAGKNSTAQSTILSRTANAIRWKQNRSARSEAQETQPSRRRPLRSFEYRGIERDPQQGSLGLDPSRQRCRLRTRGVKRYGNFRYSVLACWRIGKSESAFFQRVKKFWYVSRALAVSPCIA